MGDQRSLMSSRLEGEAPELQISRDLIRRGLIAAPLLVVVSGVIWGMDGAYSGAYGIALVLVNFTLAAVSIAVTARISLAVMMGAILFGYLVRLAILFVAFFIVKDFSWVSRPALGITMIVTHLGLLVWELKYVAGSLAYPGLKPRPVALTRTDNESC